MAPCIAVVVLYRSAGEVLICLRALTAQRGEMRVLAWDNASPDASADLAAGCAGVEVVRSPENLGFAASVNRAAAMAPGHDLLLVNPDCELAQGAVDALRAAAGTSVGVVGSRLVDAAGAPQWDAWRFPSPGRTVLGALSGMGAAYRPSRTRKADLEVLDSGFVPFTAALLSREWFDRVGGLDEAFWVYGEDADYCYRVARAGGSTGVATGSLGRHVGGASSDATARAELQLEAADRFRRKHFPAWQAAFTIVALRVGAAARLAARRGGGDRFLEWRQVAAHYRRG